MKRLLPPSFLGTTITAMLTVGCGARSELPVGGLASDVRSGGSGAGTGGEVSTQTSVGGHQSPGGFGGNGALSSTGGGSIGTGGRTQAVGGSTAGGAGAAGGSGATGGTVVAAQVTAVSAGNNFTCALLSNSSVKCWGSNASGRLGNGSDADSTLPVPVSGLSSAIAIETGDLHACALMSDYTVRCWGENFDGRLGDGTTTRSSVPVAVKGLTGATAISAGYKHTCALLKDTSAACWGDNSEGQLGADPSILSSSTPIPLTSLHGGITAIGTGRAHTCAIPISDIGAVVCWGANATLQLGDKSVIGPSYSPISVTGLNSAIELAVGDQHSCALIAGPSGGTIQCWGWNFYGQLGTGGTADGQAGNVFGISTAIAVTAADHTCARLSDGHVQCWGFNNSGEVGDGSTTTRLTPVSVVGISNAMSVSAGSVHTCALLANAELRCWGDNGFGELGNGTLTNSAVPVKVLGL